MERAQMTLDQLIEHLKTFPGQILFEVDTGDREIENYADYFAEKGLNCRYINSDVLAPWQNEIIRRFCEGEVDVLVASPECIKFILSTGIEAKVFVLPPRG